MQAKDSREMKSLSNSHTGQIFSHFLGSISWRLSQRSGMGIQTMIERPVSLNITFATTGTPVIVSLSVSVLLCCTFNSDLLALDNWAEECPDVTPAVVPPVKFPYPEPGWVEPPRSIRSLVLPIPPRPLLPTSETEPTPIPVPTTAHATVSHETTHLPSVPPLAAPANITVSHMWL
jgi:hypothetical protein